MFESIYPTRLIERNPLYSLVLGLFYAVLGISAAILLFPEDPAIVAVAFTSILFLPTISELLKKSEKSAFHMKFFSVLYFYREYKDILKVYIFFFLGVLISFSFLSLFLPNLATNYLFEKQVGIMYSSSVGQAFSSSLFFSFISNNIGVLLLCFLTSLVFSDGAVFLITWNASVWGTLFGILAKTAAINVNKDPLIYFLIVLIVVFPHMILEAISYFTSAVAGGVFSKAMFKEKFNSHGFYLLMKNVLLLLVVALIIVVAAAIVETIVLEKSTVYSIIIQQSVIPGT